MPRGGSVGQGNSPVGRERARVLKEGPGGRLTLWEEASTVDGHLSPFRPGCMPAGGRLAGPADPLSYQQHRVSVL